MLRSKQFLLQNLPIIVPCDTIYGFVGRVPYSDQAIRNIKGRGEKKPFLILIDTPSISEFSNQILPNSLLSYWPGPLTVIVRTNEKWQKRGVESVALRYPNDPWLLSLISEAKTPIYSTSCNRSGKPALNTIEAIIAEFGEEVPLIVEAGKIEGAASTIIDCTKEPYTLLREGALKIDLLQFK